MKRRDFNHLILSSLLFPRLGFSNQNNQKRLVLLELKGGNDGLSTIIPYSQKKYYEYRLKSSIQKDHFIKINNDIAFNPHLTFFNKLLLNKELSILQGVGYENPNLSHFRSIDIWNSASRSNEFIPTGWGYRLLENLKHSSQIDGVVVGSNELGPMSGVDKNILAIKKPKRYFHFAQKQKSNKIISNNETLNHVLRVEKQIETTSDSFLNHQSFSKNYFETKNRFEKDLLFINQLMKFQPSLPLYKVSLSGFDTHANQINPHNRLMKELNNGLEKFVTSLKKNNLFKDTLILTYSEFGRRPKENGSFGTDHGTSNVHFAIGGKIKSGLFGKYPRLDELQDDNLIHHLDFKAIYSEIISEHFKLSRSEILGGNFKKVGFL